MTGRPGSSSAQKPNDPNAAAGAVAVCLSLRYRDGAKNGNIANVYIFSIIGAFILAIAWLTVSFQAIRAAGVNPVKSLRSE